MNKKAEDRNGPREEKVKKKIKKHMANYHFLLTDPAFPHLKRSKSAKSLKSQKGPKIPEYYYIYTARPQLLPRSAPRSAIGTRASQKSAKRRTLKVSNNTTEKNKKDTERLVNAAAKLLVATETVESIDSARSPRPQTAPRSFEDKRPHTAKYTYDINGRKIFNTQLSYYDSSHDNKSKRSQSARSPTSPTRRPSSPTPSHTSDDTYSSSISINDIERLKTPATTKTRTYISDNKEHKEEEIRVSKTIQTSDNDTTVGIQTEKKLLEKYDHMEDEVKDGPWAEYQIFIQTGNTNGASTKADVRITLYGDKGRSKEFVLTDSKNHKIKFQKGKEDLFMVAAHHVGKLQKIKIGHDRPELSYAWYLDNVTISDMHDKRVYDLPCFRWLSGQSGDKNTYIYLNVKRDRAFVESIETSYEATKPRENLRKLSNNNNRNPQRPLKSANVKQRNLRKQQQDRSETDTSEQTSSIIDDKQQTQTSPKKKQMILRDNSKSQSSGSYTSSQTRTDDSETESDSESTEENVISLKDSPRRKADKERKISNDSSNKANGPTFTFRSKDAKTKGKTESLTGEVVQTNKNDKKKSNKEDESEKRVDKEYLQGYKAGLEAAEVKGIKKREDKLEEEKRILTQGQTIHEAAWNGNIERIKQLVDHFPELKNSKDENGMVALHKAVINGQASVTKWLAASGVDLDIETPTSYTSIHLAALHGHVNILMILSAMGSEISCMTIDKQTPLHLAARGGHLQCVKWLVANRAEITAEDSFGRKAVDLAEEFEQDIVADFLRACEKELDNPNSGFSKMYLNNSSQDQESPKRSQTDHKENLSQKSENGSEDSSTTSVSSVSHDRNIEERRKSYDRQHTKMAERGKSFLDSIRQDVEEDD